MRKMMIVKAAVVAISFALTGVPLALAHEGEVHADAAPAAAAAPVTKALPMAAGEVTKVDTEQGKLSIKHAAIPNLGMVPMTMVFKAGTGKASASMFRRIASRKGSPAAIIPPLKRIISGSIVCIRQTAPTAR